MSDLAEQILAETRDEIHRADNKASITLAGTGVAVGAVVAGIIAGDVSLKGKPLIVCLLAISAAFLVAGGVLSLGAAVYPRLGKPEPGRARYFREIATFPDTKSLREALGQEAGTEDERVLQQLLALSKIVNRKYELTRAGMVIVTFGFVLAAAASVAAWIS